MRTFVLRLPFVLLASAALILGGLGCSQNVPAVPVDSGSAPSERSPAAGMERSGPGGTPSAVERDPEKLPPGVKRAELGKHVWLETQGARRRVRIEASMCKPGGYGLEFVLSTQFKGYESLLATEAEASTIHAALLATGATPGHPVRFDPQYQPPTGTPLKVSLEYVDKGKLVTLPAQRWVRNAQTKKEETLNWVFAGSRFWEDPDDPAKKVYAAKDGAYICVINLPTAMIDLTVHTPGNPENRAFEAFTERLPPENTKVAVILEPIIEKEDDKPSPKK